MANPRIASLLRRLEHLISSGADQAKVNEVTHDLRNLGHNFDAVREEAAPEGRKAPELSTATPSTEDTPVKRGPGRPKGTVTGNGGQA